MERPLRIYEPNIIHNPLKWMGIWTPHGWRVHRKRFGVARRVTVKLNGDGNTTFFPTALIDPKLQRVAWRDDLHLEDDSFTDGGIYPCDPRVEYPPGRPRWAVSHSLLSYPVADHNLYSHEYTWDMTRGGLHTHFREHQPCEEARTDGRDGMTVQVRHRPISTTIEGNVCYPSLNSAVRGVWSSPEKTGTNYYSRRVVQKIAMHNGVYAEAPFTPVVQCHGLYELLPGDDTTGLFDEIGLCHDADRLIKSLLIPYDEPRIALLDLAPFKSVPSAVYECDIGMLAKHFDVVSEAYIKQAKRHVGSKFELGRVGYAFENARDSDEQGYGGYTTRFDLNGDGVVGDDDISRLAQHVGRKVRLNLYHAAYFGGDWLSTSVCLTPNHEPGVPVIADYEYGGGYDAHSATIRLLRTPGPNKPVWVDYHHDAPAAAGDGNIIVHLYREEI